MVEERGTDNVHHVDPDCDRVGVQRIGDILRQLIDERGWPPLPGITQNNVNRPGANGDHTAAAMPEPTVPEPARLGRARER